MRYTNHTYPTHLKMGNLAYQRCFWEYQEIEDKLRELARHPSVSTEEVRQLKKRKLDLHDKMHSMELHLQDEA
ncbi:MAG: YdcH family protein [Alphaproteobacteria bacterium]